MRLSPVFTAIVLGDVEYLKRAIVKDYPQSLLTPTQKLSDAFNTYADQPPLHFALNLAVYTDREDPEIIQTLLDYGADPLLPGWAGEDAFNILRAAKIKGRKRDKVDTAYYKLLEGMLAKTLRKKGKKRGLSRLDLYEINMLAGAAYAIDREYEKSAECFEEAAKAACDPKQRKQCREMRHKMLS